MNIKLFSVFFKKSTIFLECLSSNIPSLLVLDISSANLNSESKNFLFTLEKCKIIHRNNEKLLNVDDTVADTDHATAKDQINTFEKIISDLKHELNQFLQQPI